ncbi:hypothetical protein [Sphingobacterium bovistauri]|uniref:Uncharacterized protein n=1 Tax=Sphingobacterium bovistauri TaxID=2781959 RepID=A0ABS7Z5M8_9SPHI|nr:hypothetical protein [Sphingobacterium bovistauri]MCA5004180.1 hypothetical protein [Sphingobacterium bovistauri]
MKLILFTLVLILSYNNSFSQHKVCVDVVKNDAGKYYILYSDSTWDITSKSTFDVYNIVKSNISEKTVSNRVTYLGSKPIQSSTTNTIQTSTKSSKKKTSTTSSICWGRTKKGSPCQRRVVGGGYCYQHR